MYFSDSVICISLKSSSSHYSSPQSAQLEMVWGCPAKLIYKSICVVMWFYNLPNDFMIYFHGQTIARIIMASVNYSVIQYCHHCRSKPPGADRRAHPRHRRQDKRSFKGLVVLSLMPAPCLSWFNAAATAIKLKRVSRFSNFDRILSLFLSFCWKIQTNTLWNLDKYILKLRQIQSAI